MKPLIYLKNIYSESNRRIIDDLERGDSIIIYDRSRKKFEEVQVVNFRHMTSTIQITYEDHYGLDHIFYGSSSDSVVITPDNCYIIDIRNLLDCEPVIDIRLIIDFILSLDMNHIQSYLSLDSPF